MDKQVRVEAVIEPKEQGGNNVDGVRLFRGLDPVEAEAILAAGRVTRRKRGNYFFQESAPSDRFYVLISGRINLARQTPGGRRQVIRIATPGEAFGAVAVFGQRHYPVSAQAAADSQAVGWSGRVMRRLMERHPKLAMNIIELLAERVHDLQERFQELATQQVQRRLARMLLRLAEKTGKPEEGGILIDMVLSRRELAEMTGTTLFTASRLLRQWHTQGVVQATRQKVLIRQRHRLNQIAEELD